MTAIYSVLHLLVDGVCALAMFGSFLNRENGYLYVLVYNFCAFALQMPFGILLDMAEEKFGRQRRQTGAASGRADPAFLTAAAGILFTVTGAMVHPALLGVGNGLFHVGGGAGCIRQDRERNWQGRGLGVFVAPGALGLYLGTLLAQAGKWREWYGLFSLGMAALCAAAVYYLKRGKPACGKDCPEEGKASYSVEGVQNRSGDIFRVSICCLAAVILRSYMGMAVAFPWKTGGTAGCLAVLALVFGKAAGGFCAARFGVGRTVSVSLSLAAPGFLFSALMPAGLAAVFLFNMTMPVTLYGMAESMPRTPGLAFGFLTFGLFLGFLPGYFGYFPRTGGNLAGAAGCAATLVLLVWGMRRRKR